MAESVVASPAIPYRGIRPFRYADHAIFFAREDETRVLSSLVAVYRGVFLYGDSGSGKSSLVNAGLLPLARGLGLEPVGVRVQPRIGEELVVEPIAISEDADDVLPCVLAKPTDKSSRVVLSIADFEQRVRDASGEHRPLLVFDQFEEILTLFDDNDMPASRNALAEMIVRLQRDSLPVKMLFAFREDYLGRVKQLLAARPELVDQALRLGPPSERSLTTIISGPFERFPGRFKREFDTALVQRLRAALADRFANGDVSLSEVQIVCMRLWVSPDPHTLLTEKGVQGLLEDELGEALNAFPPELRQVAVAVLSHMVTAAGTRNVVSAEDLRQRVREEDRNIAAANVDAALDRLEDNSKLVRRERRRDLYLYEITSEFLVPWISERRDELRLERERERERKRLRLFGAIMIVALCFAATVAVIALWALSEQRRAERQAEQGRSLALASSATPLLKSRPDVSLLLGLEAYRASARAETRGSVIAALTASRDPGAPAILAAHTSTVFDIAMSPDGQTLASASADGTVRLWSIRDRAEIGDPLAGDGGALYTVAFSPDGRTLVAGGDDGWIGLWDVGTRRTMGVLAGHRVPVTGVAFSPDGRTLATAGADGTLRLWSTRTQRRTGRPPARGDGITSLAFSPDGRTLAVGRDDAAVRLYGARTGEQVGSALTGHSDVISAVDFSGDGRTLASASQDGTIRLWNVTDGKQIGAPLTGHTGAVHDVAFSPDAKTLTSGGDDKTVRSWSIATGKQIGAPLTGHASSVYSVAFNDAGDTLATAGADATIRLWDPRVRKPLSQPAVRTNSVYSVAMSTDASKLASATDDNTIRLWNIATGKQIGPPLTGHASAIYSVAFSRDGTALASASEDRTIRLWDVAAQQPAGAPLTGHTSAVYSVTFRPDGELLASASDDGTIRLWNVGMRRQIGAPLTGHDGAVFGVAFSRDGRKLASAGDDDTIRLWDVDSREQIGEPLTGHTSAVTSVAFSPDSRMLASAGADNTIRLWDVANGKQLGEPLTGATDSVDSVAFSSSGREVVAASIDNSVTRWDVGDREQAQIASPPAGSSIYAAAFGDDRRALKSATHDNAIRLWAGLLWRSVDDLGREVCELVGESLSRTEWEQYAAGTPYRPSCR